MSNLVPFQFEGRSIRVVTDDNGEPLFVGKDICEALGYSNASKSMADHCKGVTIRYPLQTQGGIQDLRVLSEPDVLRLIIGSTMPAAQAFERLVFEEILPTIRKTGAYSTAGSKIIIPSAIDPSKEFHALFGIAMLIGCDKPAAAISANQAVVKLTGTNILALLGQTHIEAENQDGKFFTPTELGSRIGVSARKVNLLLAEAGLQAKIGDAWEVIDAGKSLSRIYDTGKRHSDGVPIQQIKWLSTVLPLLKQGDDA